MAERKGNRRTPAAMTSSPPSRKKSAGGAKSRRQGGKSGSKSGSKSGGRSGGRSGAKSAGGPARSPLRRVALGLAKWTLVSAIWATVVVAGLVAWYAYDLPDIDRLDAPTREASVSLTTEDGKVFATYGDLYGDPVRLADVPPYLVQAIVATEDRRFFQHSGFDPFALVRALVANVRAGYVRQGGSTLTQQLAKNIFLKPERTIRRKVQELLLAFWLEANFNKEQIFTLYINRVYLGAGTYGVEAAARRYFGKSSRRVSLHEAAVLAGLLKAPSRYSPLRDREAAERRAAVVLQAMVDAGFLDARTAAETARRRLAVAAAATRSHTARYFADWVLEQVAGFVGRTGSDLVVTTTLDLRLQQIAEDRLRAMIAARGKAAGLEQAAFVAMSPDGAVLAMVGGRDYGDSQFNRSVQALRQPGSAFKIFVYLAGLEAGMTPGDRLVDGPLRIGRWQPRNYTNAYTGTVTLREAVARSINTVAVQVSERAGREKVIGAARRLGITTPIKPHPSLALGASEVTLLQLTAAYGVVANGGMSVWPTGILQIRDRAGRILYRRASGGAAQVIEPATAAGLHDMLRGVVAWGTGRKADPGRPAAGKTGTSQDFRDAWFVGYTPRLVAGVWMGNDDGRPMNRVTGGGLPASLWRSIVTDALHGLPPGVDRPTVFAPPPAPAPVRQRWAPRPGREIVVEEYEQQG